jgi:major vault protein
MADVREKRDLVLPPGEYAFMQDTTKGVVKVYNGPTVINPSAQEVPVVFDEKSLAFRAVASLEEAKCKSKVLPEGFYAVLRNPAKNGHQPQEGTAQLSADLDIGHKVVVRGPAMFALWPGQVAEVVRGHQLRHNQYLLARVYNEKAARENWTKAILKPAAPVSSNPTSGDGTSTDLSKQQTQPTTTVTQPAKATAEVPGDLSVGKLLIIKGTEVSFYIPPTGITVVQDGFAVGSDLKQKPNYVREALTLERLEYAILVDEAGTKRYAKGPTVVFPEPTERFIESKGQKKFEAIELNKIQGIHLKVIADYKEGDREHKTGEELFITGEDTAIYYPREEHSAIKYDGKTKHFATAVPTGEARYVLNRHTGDIKTVRGPAMLLPDPRTEVIVRRVLNDKECQSWYPGNMEVLSYNQNLRQVLNQVPTTRGAPSEGDVLRNAGKGTNVKATMLTAQAMNSAIAFGDNSRVSGEQGLVGSEFERSANYTQPRMITLDTKFQGVPSVVVWTGYAALVVNKAGQRRVVQGPATVLLDYDETLEVLELSTGKPKTTDSLLRTAFLRVENNQVTDLVTVETSDHVSVNLKLFYRVNFEDDSSKWWAVENYVKFLCDHMRSVLKGAVRTMPVERFYRDSTQIIRDTLLGDKGGKLFKENNMRLTDVEVLVVEIADPNIRSLLANSQTDVVKSNIELSTARRRVQVVKEKEEMDLELVFLKTKTQKETLGLERELAGARLAVTLQKLASQIEEHEKEKELTTKQIELRNFEHSNDLTLSKNSAQQELALSEARQKQKIELLKAEAETIVQKFGAAQAGFSEALLALSHNETMVKVAEAWNIQRALGGESVSDALSRIFQGTPLASLVDKMAKTQTPALPNGNGKVIGGHTLNGNA